MPHQADKKKIQAAAIKCLVIILNPSDSFVEYIFEFFFLFLMLITSLYRHCRRFVKTGVFSEAAQIINFFSCAKSLLDR